MSATSRRNRTAGKKTTVRKLTFPRCPKCGAWPTSVSDGLWWCPECEMGFDDDPGEGGDHSDDPTKRIERENNQ